jgi:hypothetical protein
LTYVLIPLVIAIWGYAGYRYLFELQEQDEVPAQVPTTALTVAAALPAARDTSALGLQYRDPFLSGMDASSAPAFGSELPPAPTQQAPAPVATPVQAAPSTPAAPAAVDWSAYRYNGLIQRSGTSQQVGILRIHSKSHYVQVGSKAQAAEVLRLDGDSIQVRVGTETKIIGRR